MTTPTTTDMESLVDSRVRNLVEFYKDGFQLSDIKPTVVEVVAAVSDIPWGSGEEARSERRRLAIGILRKVIRETDTPWLPDSVFDPIMEALVPLLVDRCMQQAQGG